MNKLLNYFRFTLAGNANIAKLAEELNFVHVYYK